MPITRRRRSNTVRALLATAALLAFGLGGCAPLTGDNTKDRATITAEVQRACLLSPLFKDINGAVALAVPAANIPAELADAGITIVCTTPELVGDLNADTADWVMALLKRHNLLRGTPAAPTASQS